MDRFINQTGLLEACMYFNGHMKWPQNQPANLCLMEDMVNSPLFSYPYLNKYYCLGWNTTALTL